MAAETDFCAPETKEKRFLCWIKRVKSGTMMSKHEPTAYVYLPVLIKLKERLVLSGAQHQEINEEEHAQRVRIWVQTEMDKTTSDKTLRVLNVRVKGNMKVELPDTLQFLRW